MDDKQLQEKSAEYLAKVLKNPAGIAKTMFSIFSAMCKAGFTEEQAMQVTQWITAMIIGIGGMNQ